MVPVLHNKEVSVPTCNDLKFTVQNRNYICTNLIEKHRNLDVSPFVSYKNDSVDYTYNTSPFSLASLKTIIVSLYRFAFCVFFLMVT